MPLFKKFVEIGRVCSINSGKFRGRMVVIVDVVDSNRALINGLTVPRMQISFSRLDLTPLVINAPRGAGTKVLRKFITADKTEEKFDALPSTQRRKRYKLRASTDDFTRFKIMVARKKRSLAIRQEVNKMKKATRAKK